MQTEQQDISGLTVAPGGCGVHEMDKVLESKEYRVENKKFFFDLKENIKGRYLRITESSGGRSAIVVPEAGLGSFAEIVGQFAAQVERAPGTIPSDSVD